MVGYWCAFLSFMRCVSFMDAQRRFSACCVSGTYETKCWYHNFGTWTARRPWPLEHLLCSERCVPMPLRDVQYKKSVQWNNTMHQYNEPIQWTNTRNQYNEPTQWTNIMPAWANAHMNQWTNEALWTHIHSIHHYTQRGRGRDRGRGKGLALDTYTLQLHCTLHTSGDFLNWFRKSLHRFAALNSKSPFC